MGADLRSAFVVSRRSSRMLAKPSSFASASLVLPSARPSRVSSTSESSSVSVWSASTSVLRTDESGATSYFAAKLNFAKPALTVPFVVLVSSPSSPGISISINTCDGGLTVAVCP